MWPNYVLVAWKDWTDTPRPVTEYSEMERGPIRSRRINSRVLEEAEFTAVTNTAQQMVDFEAWWRSPTGGNCGQNAVSFPHPRLGTVTAYVIDPLGSVQTPTPNFRFARRRVKVRYYR